MALRAALVRAGFTDSIEVSPGSFLVAAGSVDAETARTLIEAIPGVLDVLRTNSATASPDPSSEFPSWWAAMIATLIAAAVVLAVSKSRSDQS
jgi:cell division protein FtsX